LNVLNSQSLDRRIPDKQTLVNEVAAWNLDRNQKAASVNWQFTSQAAHIKLKSLYPSFHA
jgi:hypothetical protein